MAKEKFTLDAQGTNGEDPAKIVRVYWDGTRQPMTEPERMDTPFDALDKAPTWLRGNAKAIEERAGGKSLTVPEMQAVITEMWELLVALRDLVLPAMPESDKP